MVPILDFCPSDILLEIFDHALPFPLQQYQLKKYHLALAILRRVCRHWDNVVISTSRYWSFIRISFPYDIPPHSALQKWLVRSGSAGLEVSLRDNGFGHEWTSRELGLRTEVLYMIKPHISHCRRLQLDLSQGVLLGFQTLRLSEAHRLEDLEVHMLGNMDRQDHEIVVRQLKSIPSQVFHRLKWSTSYATAMELLLRHNRMLPWLSQLIRVEVTCPTTTYEMVKLMCRCTHAIRVSFATSVWENASAPLHSINPTTTSFRNLLIFDISLNLSAYRTLLRQIHMPNLRVLKARGLRLDDWADTIRLWAPSTEFLKVEPITDLADSVLAFLSHPSVLPLSVLQVELSQRSLDGHMDDEARLRRTLDTFNQTQINVKSAILGVTKTGQYKDYCIGWVDTRIYDKYVKEFPLDTDVLRLRF